MTVVVAALVVVVALLTVLVAGLLRSHATILKRLHELGAGIETDPGAPVPATAPGPRAVPRTDGTVPAPAGDVPDGRRGADVDGAGPRGEAIATRVVDVAHDTMLVFLSTGCTTCAGFWDDLATPDLPAGTRLLIVTRDPQEESPSSVLELAPPGATVVMSTRAWEAFAVPGSPYVVLVDGPSGRVVGEGTAASWEQVLALFLRAGGDEAVGAGGKAAADRRRERQLDRILLESGIAPGDASLYASSGPSDPGERPVDVPDGGGTR